MSGDQFLSDIELRSPQRNPTIESGRPLDATANQPRRRGVLLRLIEFFRARAEAHRDAIQKSFAKSIADIENAEPSHHAPGVRHMRHLSKEYGKFKDRPAVMCHRLFQYWNFAVTTQDAITTRKFPIALNDYFITDNNANKLIGDHFHKRLQGKASVSDWMSCVVSMLEGKTRDCLELIAIAEEPGSEDLARFFSFTHYTQATIRGNLKTIYSEPVWTILFVVAVNWGIDMLPWSPGSGTQDAHGLTRSKPLLPPSLRPAHNAKPRPSCRTYWGLGSQRQGNLDPDRGDNEIYLTWLREVTSFTRDLNVYIWEPHTSFPSPEHAKIILCPPQDQEDAMRLLISLRSCRLLSAYTDKRDACSALESVPALGGTESQHWSNALLSVLCVLEVLVSDTAEFLQSYHEEAGRMRVASRQNPTISKLRFMMHLEDSREMASDGVKHAIRVLGTLNGWADRHIQPKVEATSPDGAALLHSKTMATLQEDLEFCDRELERLRSYTEADQETLRRHFQLSQDLTLFRLTLLAAIFLPLSFTTSLFGMNMRNTDEGPSFLSDVTNSTLENITDTNLRSSAGAIVSMVASSGNLNYDWAVFAGTAVGLVFILPFTLAVGSIMRVTVVSTVRYVKYWRAPALLAGGFLLLAMMTSSILGRFLYDKHDGRTFYRYPYRWTFYALCAYWVANGLLLLVLIFLVYQSWSEGKERLFWTTQLLLTSICFIIDIRAEPLDFLPMIIPWLWLGLLNSWTRRRWGMARFSIWG